MLKIAQCLSTKEEEKFHRYGVFNRSRNGPQKCKAFANRVSRYPKKRPRIIIQRECIVNVVLFGGYSNQSLAAERRNIYLERKQRRYPIISSVENKCVSVAAANEETVSSDGGQPNDNDYYGCVGNQRTQVTPLRSCPPGCPLIAKIIHSTDDPNRTNVLLRSSGRACILHLLFFQLHLQYSLFVLSRIPSDAVLFLS